MIKWYMSMQTAGNFQAALEEEEPLSVLQVIMKISEAGEFKVHVRHSAREIVAHTVYGVCVHAHIASARATCCPWFALDLIPLTQPPHRQTVLRGHDCGHCRSTL